MQLLSNLLWLLPLGLTCQDFHDSCAAWAKHGECEQNPAYMKARMDPQPAVEPGFLSHWMLPALFQCPWCPLVPLGVPGTMCHGVQLLRLVHFSLPLARIDAGHCGRCRQSRLAERGWSCAWRQSSGGRLESPWDRTFHPELTG